MEESTGGRSLCSKADLKEVRLNVRQIDGHNTEELWRQIRKLEAIDVYSCPPHPNLKLRSWTVTSLQRACPYYWFIAAVSLFHHPSALHITGHEPLSFLFYYLTPSHHLLHLIILSSLPPHTSGQAMLCRPWRMHSTITLMCHHSSEIADGLLSLTPLLTEFTAMPSLSPASPPLSLALSVFLLSSLIPFRGKSILLGSGSKSCGSEHLVCLSWLVWEGQEVVIKSGASCTTQCTGYRLGNDTRFNLKTPSFLLQVLLLCVIPLDKTEDILVVYYF